MKYISKLSLLAVLSFTLSPVSAGELNVSKFGDMSARYLEEKTAYCHTQEGLSKYLDFAKASDINSLNQLVLNGSCNFVPDGQVFNVGQYSDAKIGNTPVIAFHRDDETLWTFKAFVNTVAFDVGMR